MTTSGCDTQAAELTVARTRSKADRPLHLSGEAGVSLIEVLTAIAMLGVIFTAAVGFYQVVVKRTEDTGARRNTIADTRTSLEKISRDVRIGRSATVGAGGASLTITGPAEKYFYDCTSGDCTRSVLNKTTNAVISGPVKLVDDVATSPAIFATVNPFPDSSAASVGVRIAQLPDGRDRAVAMTGEYALRNDCVIPSSTLLPACS